MDNDYRPRGFPLDRRPVAAYILSPERVFIDMLVVRKLNRTAAVTQL